jgi:hypothetical protein
LAGSRQRNLTAGEDFPWSTGILPGNSPPLCF